MTCREKLMQEHPEYMNLACFGGCVGCPNHYGYLPKPDNCDELGCAECWDREIPEPKKNAKPTIPWSEIHKIINEAFDKGNQEISLYFNPDTGMTVHIYPARKDES